MKPPSTDVTLAAKVAHLRRPESYAGEATRAVEVVETHMSWVFLTERYAYKIKKPVRNGFRDLTTLEARRFNCDEEVRLNRRLAPDVYLGVVALRSQRGALVIDGPGVAVEWVVKMRRLPRRLMLDAAIRERRLAEGDVARFVAILAAFYRSAERTPLPAEGYCARIERSIHDNRAALSKAQYALEIELVREVSGAQLSFLERNARALGERACTLVDGHGDLRPEHVCLEDPPVFIDCLEFDRGLRIVDPADELSYLAMECLFLGDRALAGHILDAYRAATGDAVGEALVRFYQACRAVTRARLAASHLDDAQPNGGRPKWSGQARAYLELARDLLVNPAGAPPESPPRACV